MQMLAPDIASQQAQMARQQQMADMLREQAMQPDSGTEMAGGWAVRKSPWQGVAKVANALMGAHVQKQVDAKQLGLAKAMQERMSGAFDGMAGGNTGGLGAPGSSAMNVAPAGPDGVPLPAADGAGAPAAPQMDAITKIRNQAKAAYMMGNTELANKLLENISTLTTEQRNMAATGQDPMEMGRLATAAARKGGIIELQPGATALDLSTGVERFQPKVGEGITLNGGQASAIPGYAGANAEISGANAAAVSGANAQNEMTTVNTAGGPVMMTKAQAVQMAGGAPQAGTHFTNPDPGGMSLNFKGNPQAVFDRLSKLPEPHRAEALAAFSQYAGQPAAGGTGAPGIKLKTPAQEAAEMAAVKLGSEPQIAQKTQEYKDMADYGRTLDGHVSESQALLQRVAESREALTKFKAGGGAETKAKMASMAQAFGLPDGVVNKIAGGDLAAAQVFQKFAAQEALGTMQQALASDSGKGAQGNRISMELFIKNNPNITTDPNAIEKVFNFITKQAQQSKAQQEAYHAYKSDPKNDPSAFPGYWAGESIKRGYVTPELVTGKARGTTPANVQSILNKYK